MLAARRSILKARVRRADASSMSTTTPSLAELLDRAGDREDQRVIDHAAMVKPADIVAGWTPGDDDILPSGRGRRQRGVGLRRALGR
jgi:hypothetical protein